MIQGVCRPPETTENTLGANIGPISGRAYPFDKITSFSLTFQMENVAATDL